MRRDTVWLCGSTTQTAGRAVGLGERARRNLHAGRRGQPDAAGDGGSQPHGVRRIDDADLDLECPGRGVRLRRNLPHAAGRLHLRIVGEGDLDHGVARARPNELLGHVEHGVAPALTRELHDHLPGADHFARLGADRGDHARGISGQGRVAQLILRDAQLRLAESTWAWAVSSFCWASSNLRAGCPAILQELLLPPKARRACVSTASAEARLACAERSAFC